MTAELAGTRAVVWGPKYAPLASHRRRLDRVGDVQVGHVVGEPLPQTMEVAVRVRLQVCRHADADGARGGDERLTESPSGLASSRRESRWACLLSGVGGNMHTQACARESRDELCVRVCFRV